MNVLYSTTFEYQSGGKVELVMEPDSVAGEWTIGINNSREITAGDFNKTGAHVYGSLVPISPLPCKRE